MSYDGGKGGALATPDEAVTYTCWSESERSKRAGEAIIHAQGRDSRTVCGIRYGALWQFQWWDGPWQDAIGCFRCRRKLQIQEGA